MAGVDRAALIEAADRAVSECEPIAGGWGCYCQPKDDEGRWIPLPDGGFYRHLSELILSAALPLVAQAIEAHADERRAAMSQIVGREMTHDTAVGCGVRFAARLVRSLAEEGQQQ